MAITRKVLTLKIKEKALDLGFNLCGIAESRALSEYEHMLKKWCNSGMNGKLNYLGQNIEKRVNPCLLFPGVKSIVVTGMNYFTPKKQVKNQVPVLSRYAYGENYHDVIKRRLNILFDFIRNIEPETVGNAYVDSAPLLEKAWAREAGIGWQGRHSIVINDKIGSFFFIGILVLNIDLEYDDPFSKDYCGDCRICIDQCPTGAINENRTIDTRKCIAYLTIENRGSLPEEIIPKMGRRIFGCDKCQEVCPWNKNARSHGISEFNLSEEVQKMTLEEWQNLTKEKYTRLFKKSAIGRTKYDLLIRNILAVTKS
jgi:epoxyqueuosine reductase